MTASKNPGCLGALFRLFSSTPRSQPVVSITTESPEVYPYRVRDDFLSQAELLFYQVLKAMLGDRLVICPQVSLAGFLFVSGGEAHQAYQNKIDRKRVDFLLCEPLTLKPVLGIELDDASHRRPDRQERDAFVEKVFADANLPLARVPVQAAYNTRELAALFQAALQKRPAQSQTAAPTTSETSASPICPKCGIPMVKRVARRGNAPGQFFWGCPNYPRCREMLPEKVTAASPAKDVN